ncbi:hypothetical protein [Ruminococcus sp. FC2018]|uniref:hypothetical protein n=1 Tax=Ruminococcus sp. FC2018 TaxID=1410617 RepID=UPI00049207F8|nr:hypothetical protein [Ruminococcus sp. FC2018]
MKRIYKARIISASDTQVTYEYADTAGFVQISSLPPSGIKVSVGDTVHITVEDGEVIAVSKGRGLLSTPFGIKLVGVLTMIIMLLVLWLVWRILKKVIIFFVWGFILLLVGVYIFTRFRR